MLVIKDTDHLYQGEELNMSLLGVVNVPKSVDKYGIEHTFDFLMSKHPVRPGISTHIRPVWTRKIVEDKGQATVFAIFVGTKDANPQSNRKLPTEAVLSEFREQNNVIEFDSNWATWEDVINEQH